MPDIELKPEMSFKDLVEALNDALSVADPFERWLMQERAQATALASEHYAGCRHHIEMLVLDKVLQQYRRRQPA